MSALYLKHQNGITHQLSGRRLKTLIKELKAGRGGPEITALIERGYVGFLGPDGELWDLSGLTAEVLSQTAG